MNHRKHNPASPAGSMPYSSHKTHAQSRAHTVSAGLFAMVRYVLSSAYTSAHCFELFRLLALLLEWALLSPFIALQQHAHPFRLPVRCARSQRSASPLGAAP